MKSRFAISSLDLMALPANATDLNLGINDDVLSADVEMNLNKSANLVLDYIYSNDDGHAVSAAAHMVHSAGVHHFEIGQSFLTIGPKQSQNGSLLSIGGRYSMELGFNISLKTSAYCAPSLFSFGDIDGQYELDGRNLFQLNPALGLFVGYRNIRLQYDNRSNSTFDNGFYICTAARF
ncbi:YfaZ family protein [Shewanella mesophila]|uniref:YfaZ family outer membrane protein n=1 Tax=Shewanella mesophila TaxID=2864208 RepID=UPI001C65EBC3|nr:YfaZ family outer membrane protein [Shewanella mesophila]QYJ87206.1 YfaZ family protein [Shewanella mesophila]